MTTAMAQVPLRGPDGKLLPGAQLNPGGTTRGQFSPTEYLRSLVQTRFSWIENIVEQAEKGSYRHQELILDRLDGKAVQTTVQVNISANWADALSTLAGGPGLQAAELPKVERATIIDP